jgi:hypothetical protein
MVTSKEWPSIICLILICLWLLGIIIFKLMLSSASANKENSNRFDLLLFQTSATSQMQIKKQRKSAIGKLFDSDQENTKKNDKIKEENVKACLEANFDINSLLRNDDF